MFQVYADGIGRSHLAYHEKSPLCVAFTEPHLGITELRKRLDSYERIEEAMIKFFRFNDTVSLQTDETTEADFNKKYNAALIEVMNEKTLGDDFPLFLDRIQMRRDEIICKLRGYKADVKEQRLLTTGDVAPTEDVCIVSVNNRGEANLTLVPKTNGKAASSAVAR